MTPHRVTLTKLVQQELAVEIYADTAREAERLALDLIPEDSREWTTVHREVVAKAEDACRP